MAPFGFLRTSNLSRAATPETKRIVARYERLRQVRLRLNNELVSRLSHDALDEGGRKLGILRKGVFVFDSEDETSVLMDYCIYNVYRRGRNAIEQYLCDSPPDPDSEEMACLRAMQHATYALIVVESVVPGVGCQIRNLYTVESRLLVDFGFSQSAEPGALMATRLLDFGEFLTTSGAALPVGILDQKALDEWERKLRTGVDDPSADPAPMIRNLLERGVSSHIRYENSSADRRLDAAEDHLDFESPPHHRPKHGKRHSNKPAGNRRCRCGSGRMFKNCCGKHKITSE